MLRNSLRIALVGCGAVTEHRHLPALARRDNCEVVALVDHDQGRAKRLSAHCRVPHILTDYRDLLNLDLDAAIIALPNHLHAPVSIELLRAGIHVLVEKPMAPSAAECDSMLLAAETGESVLAVGLTRRFIHAGRFTKGAVDSGLLGRIVSFDIRDGFIFNWPLASDFFFRKEAAGGGVLMDVGVHALDQLLWWLGDVKSFEYYDNCYGGVESDCELQVTLQSGVKGVVELSRTRNLRNTAILRGERAELEVGTFQNSISLRLFDGAVGITGQGASRESKVNSIQSQIDIIAAEHEDFLEAIRTGCPPAVPGAEGRRSVALIGACYAKRRPLNLPWGLAQPTLVCEEIQ
jgi:predicted dehydrogenase